MDSVQKIPCLMDIVPEIACLMDSVPKIPCPQYKMKSVKRKFNFDTGFYHYGMPRGRHFNYNYPSQFRWYPGYPPRYPGNPPSNFQWNGNRNRSQKKPAKKMPSRASSPLQGTEEYRLRKINETSERIKKKLLSGEDLPVTLHPDSSEEQLSKKYVSERNFDNYCVETIPENLRNDMINSDIVQNKKACSKEVPKITNNSCNIEEFQSRIMKYISNLSFRQKMNLINSPSSRYDGLFQQIQRQKRLESSNALSTMHHTESDKTDTNSIIPDIGIKLEDLPREVIKQISLTLGLDSQEQDIFNNVLRTSPPTGNISPKVFTDQVDENVSSSATNILQKNDNGLNDNDVGSLKTSVSRDGMNTQNNSDENIFDLNRVKQELICENEVNENNINNLLDEVDIKREPLDNINETEATESPALDNVEISSSFTEHPMDFTPSTIENCNPLIIVKKEIHDIMYKDAKSRLLALHNEHSDKVDIIDVTEKDDEVLAARMNGIAEKVTLSLSDSQQSINPVDSANINSRSQVMCHTEQISRKDFSTQTDFTPYSEYPKDLNEAISTMLEIDLEIERLSRIRKQLFMNLNQSRSHPVISNLGNSKETTSRADSSYNKKTEKQSKISEEEMNLDNISKDIKCIEKNPQSELTSCNKKIEKQSKDEVTNSADMNKTILKCIQTSQERESNSCNEKTKKQSNVSDKVMGLTDISKNIIQSMQKNPERQLKKLANKFIKTNSLTASKSQKMIKSLFPVKATPNLSPVSRGFRNKDNNKSVASKTRILSYSQALGNHGPLSKGLRNKGNCSDIITDNFEADVNINFTTNNTSTAQWFEPPPLLKEKDSRSTPLLSQCASHSTVPLNTISITAPVTTNIFSAGSFSNSSVENLNFQSIANNSPLIMNSTNTLSHNATTNKTPLLPLSNTANSSLEQFFNNSNTGTLDTNSVFGKQKFTSSQVPVTMIKEEKDFDLCKLEEKILSIAVHGNRIVAGSESGHIFVISLNTGCLLKSLKVTDHPITSLCLSKFGIYIGALENGLYCYNANTYKRNYYVDFGASVQCIENEWGCLFLGCHVGKLYRYHIKNKRIEYEDTISNGSVLVLKATQEGARRVLLVGTRNAPVCIRDAMSGLHMRTVDQIIAPTVYSLVLHRGMIFCGTTSHDILVYSFYDGKLEDKLSVTNSKGIGCIKTIENVLFASCHDGNVYAFHTKPRRFLGKISGPGGIILSMEVVKDKIFLGTITSEFTMVKVPPEISILYTH